MKLEAIADTHGRAHKWYSVDLYQGDGTYRRSIMHYTTVMLSFDTRDGKWDGNVETIDYSIGNGSVSDQNGMNRLFRHLGLPLYYSRKGGADIREVTA